MKLLLTDASQPLGQALEHDLEREPISLIVPGSARLTWTDPGEVSAYLDHRRPRLVVNTLGWADWPDEAQCRLIPAAARVLADACAEHSIPLIQVSSYRVFGGDNKSRHAERDKPSPQGRIGEAWLAAEQAVARLPRHLILRLSWPMDARGDNRLSRLLSAIFAGSSVPVSTRLRGSPTALSDVARVLVGVIRQIGCGAENWGVMHYPGGEACSEAELADRVLEVLAQLDALPERGEPPALERIETLPSDEPASAVLTGRRLRDGFGVQARAWEPYLVPTIKQWLHQRSE